METDPEVLVAAPEATLGRGDPTRRWAIARRDGSAFPGVTRPEGRSARAALKPEESWDDRLIAVTLPVLLSDGAGPHLVDASGALVLAVADHPRLEGRRVAIGPLEGGVEQLGVVEFVSEPAGVWRWSARAVVDPNRRSHVLGALDAVAEPTELPGWARDAEGSG